MPLYLYLHQGWWKLTVLHNISTARDLENLQAAQALQKAQDLEILITTRNLETAQYLEDLNQMNQSASTCVVAVPALKEELLRPILLRIGSSISPLKEIHWR